MVANTPPQPGRDQILHYLDEHGVRDKDAQSRARSRRRRPSAPLSLDLHGLTQDRAAALLRETLARCRRLGQKRLLVIHGQGLHSGAAEGAVLREMVRHMLAGECRESLRDYHGALPREGGEGATVVHL
jgi:DNA-nicking Smr family endonuclease